MVLLLTVLVLVATGTAGCTAQEGGRDGKSSVSVIAEFTDPVQFKLGNKVFIKGVEVGEVVQKPYVRDGRVFVPVVLFDGRDVLPGKDGAETAIFLAIEDPGQPGQGALDIQAISRVPGSPQGEIFKGVTSRRSLAVARAEAWVERTASGW